jgi:hypothetical protein
MLMPRRPQPIKPLLTPQLLLPNKLQTKLLPSWQILPVLLHKRTLISVRLPLPKKPLLLPPLLQKPPQNSLHWMLLRRPRPKQTPQPLKRRLKPSSRKPRPMLTPLPLRRKQMQPRANAPHN